jgi:carbamoyl-phosphate synthase large subunit
MNIQYAIANDTVYILEANPRASRTVPIVSKVCNISMARLATQILLGKTISDLGLKQKQIKHFGVKEAVFPFNMFPEVDPLLGPEMRSTGEVLGLADSFGLAFFKSQEATQSSLPTEGTVLFTIAEKDKPGSLEAARVFKELGFNILATKGTHQFFTEHGIDSKPVPKLGYGRPNLVDAIKNKEIHLVINTPSGKQSKTDSSYIRKAAINYKILNITTIAAALAAARGIAARRKGQSKVKSLQKYHEDIL